VENLNTSSALKSSARIGVVSYTPTYSVNIMRAMAFTLSPEVHPISGKHQSATDFECKDQPWKMCNSSNRL